MAAKQRGKKRHGRAGPQPASAAPKVHVKVALADADLRSAANLIKPAVLYADDVTVYSPGASMISALSDMSRVRDPRDQIALTLALVREVPQLRDQIGITDEVIDQMSAFLATDRRLVNLVARSQGADEQVTAFYRMLDEFGAMWADRMPEAVEPAKASIGAEELLTAIDRGAVKIADLLGESATAVIAESLRLATGEQSREPLDDLVASFVGRLLELVTEARTFPLFDARSSGLIRAFEDVVNTRDRTLPRAAEVATAAIFMGYLPHFSSMPMDEVIDLRREIEVPLRRFRASVARLSRAFESHPFDDTFDAEVEDAWRREVEPALVDIREALAEHGLLREVASVALGDPRRLMAEAGGVVVAAHGEVLSLSGLLTAGAAVGVPSLDVLGRALRQRDQGRRRAKSNAFYFLHRVADEAEQRR